MLAFSMRKFFWGLVIAVLGGLLWADNLGFISVSFRFSRDWPVLVVGLGLMYMWDAVFGRHWWEGMMPRRKARGEALSKILEDIEKGSLSAEEALKKMRS